MVVTQSEHWIELTAAAATRPFDEFVTAIARKITLIADPQIPDEVRITYRIDGTAVFVTAMRSNGFLYEARFTLTPEGAKLKWAGTLVEFRLDSFANNEVELVSARGDVSQDWRHLNGIVEGMLPENKGKVARVNMSISNDNNEWIGTFEADGRTEVVKFKRHP